MNKKLVRVLVGSLLALAALGMVGCDLLLEEIIAQYTISGTVIDVKDSAGGNLGVVRLQLIDEAGDVAKTTDSSSSGSFSFVDVDPGDYTIRGTAAGKAIIDTPVVLRRAGVTVDVLGFDFGAKDYDEYTISVILMWKNADVDVDAHVTFPDGWKSVQTTFSTPYQAIPTSDGFGPHTSGRGHVYYGVNNRRSTATMATAAPDIYAGDTTAVVELDVDSATDGTPGGPETVSIREIPFDWYAEMGETAVNYAIAGDGTTGNMLPTGPTYGWVGTMNFYVNGYDGNLMVEGESAISAGADLQVFLVQGSAILGSYTLPEYTRIRAAQLFRINLFGAYDSSRNVADGQYYSYFQIVPAIELRSSTGSGFAPTAQVAPEVINVRGPAVRR